MVGRKMLHSFGGMHTLLAKTSWSCSTNHSSVSHA